MKTDAELIARWEEKRDETAFAEIVSRYERLVYRVCLRILREPALAEDASQAAFLVLFRKLHAVRHKQDLSSWLYGTARNVALHALRTRRHRASREKEAAMITPQRSERDAQGSQSEARTLLDEALAALSGAQREAVILRHLRGYSSAQAASALGCTEMALRSRLSKGLAKLRQRLSRRGVALAAGGLLALLDGEAQAAVPQTLLPSVLAASKSLAAGAATGSSAALLAKGAMEMMFWAKVKVVAAVMAAIVILGVGVPVAVQTLSAQEPTRPVPQKTTIAKTRPDKDTPQGVLVNGVLFEPVLPSRIWLLPLDGALESVPVALRVTNKTKEDVYLNRYGFWFHLMDPKGNSLYLYPSFAAKKRGLYHFKREDFLRVKPGQTAMLACQGNSVYPEWGRLCLRKSIKNKRGQEAYYGGGDFRFFAVSRPGAYSLVITYRPVAAREGPPCWQGEVTGEPIPLQIVPGLRGTALLDPGESNNAASQLGDLGCLTVCSPHRWQSLLTEFRKLGCKIPARAGEEKAAEEIDFTRDRLVCLFRTGHNHESLYVKAIRDKPEASVVQFGELRTATGQGQSAWRFAAVVLPRAKQLKVSALMLKDAPFPSWPTPLKPEDVDPHAWTLGDNGGDVVDGLQGCLAVEKQSIKPGEDIRLTFTLKAVDPNRKAPIYVWDTKFSNGYNADVYWVHTPAGKTVELRRKDHGTGGIWEKNAPHRVAITPQKPYITQDWRGPTKSLKARGLDTSQPGTYTIYAVYRQRGAGAFPPPPGVAPGTTAVLARGAGPGQSSLWCGTIASNVVEVVVGKK